MELGKGETPATGAGGATMTRELHVYGHNGMIAILFVDPDGAVEAFDMNGLTRIGRFESVVDAAACACADTDVFRDC